MATGTIINVTKLETLSQLRLLPLIPTVLELAGRPDIPFFAGAVVEDPDRERFLGIMPVNVHRRPLRSRPPAAC